MIAWEYAQRTAEIMDRISPDYPWKQTLLDGALLFQSEKEYLANLFLHTTGHESFFRYMTEINCNALRNHIFAVSDKKELDPMTEMYIRIYCLGTVNLTCEWILGRHNVSPEELAEVYENSLPMPLRCNLL